MVGVPGDGHPADIPFRVGQADATAIADGRSSLTRAELRTRVDGLAAGLVERGIGRGGVVATILSNRSEFVVVMFAAWHVGAAITPVNPVLTDAEVEHQLGDSGAKLVVTEGGRRVGAGWRTVAVDDLGSWQGSVEPCERSLDDVALVIYTSGTTGRPKGVMLDHANVAAMTRLLVDELEITSSDRALLFLPLFHVNAIMASCVAPLSAGASTVILPKFERSTFWPEVEQHRPTFFSGVPAIYHLLVSAEGGPADLSFLRFVVVGAAPVPAATIVRFEERFGVPMLQGYGLSETTVACNLTPLRGPRRPGTVGPALPGVDVRTVDSNGVPVPVGEPGEVVVRGPIVMRGYLGRPDATAEAIRDGWLHTGDVGVMDAEGVLTIVDRTKDMIIRGGENIYPKEIEDAFAAMSGVLEVAVVGRPDAVMGEVPVAFVSLVDGAQRSGRDLLEEAHRVLAPYKLPVDVIVGPALPRNSVGKITKGVLRDRFGS